jgi:hypothetical protein
VLGQLGGIARNCRENQLAHILGGMHVTRKPTQSGSINQG